MKNPYAEDFYTWDLCLRTLDVGLPMRRTINMMEAKYGEKYGERVYHQY